MAPPKRLDRNGQIFHTKNCGDVEIVNYINSHNILVRFNDTGYEKYVQYSQLKSGSIIDPNVPTLFGVGIIGDGPYVSRVTGSRLKTVEYGIWSGLLERIYCPKFRYKQKYSHVYDGCSLAEEWHNFQNFAKWYCSQDNYGKGYHLDKDLKIPGNKVYGPEQCSLVPQEINKLFVGADKRRTNRETPTGVSKCKNTGKFRVLVHRGDLNAKGIPKSTYLGDYDSIEEAFLVYKEAKEIRIREVAEKFKKELDPQVYSNLMSYDMKFSFKGDIYA